MRFVCLFLILIMFSPFALADELDSMSSGWDSYNKTIENSFSGQKMITDEQFDKTIKQLKDRNSNKKKWWWSKKNEEIVPLSPVPFKPDTYDNNEMQSVYNKLEHTPTIMIPTNVVTEDGVRLAPGFYKLSNKKMSDNSYSFLLTQGTTLLATLPAKHTNVDYEQHSINFVNVTPISDRYLKVIYGTLDLNLEAILEIKN